MESRTVLDFRRHIVPVEKRSRCERCGMATVRYLDEVDATLTQLTGPQNDGYISQLSQL